MAIKDWEKLAVTSWNKKNNRSFIIVVGRLDKIFRKKGKGIYHFTYGDESKIGESRRKYFKTQPQALKYALNYMRTH